LAGACLEEEVSRLASGLPSLAQASEIVRDVCFAESLCDFVTLPAYDRLVTRPMAPNAPQQEQVQ
jgi:hypothetical protein